MVAPKALYEGGKRKAPPNKAAPSGPAKRKPRDWGDHPNARSTKLGTGTTKGVSRKRQQGPTGDYIFGHEFRINS